MKTMLPINDLKKAPCCYFGFTVVGRKGTHLTDHLHSEDEGLIYGIDSSDAKILVNVQVTPVTNR